MQVVLKLKGDILADAELPLVFSEIHGLVGNSCMPVQLSCSLFPMELREIPGFCTLLTRKTYKGSVQAFGGTPNFNQLQAVKNSSAYVSDIFAWACARDSENCLDELLHTLGVNPRDTSEPMARPGIRVYKRGDYWLVHIVPLYWYLEYGAHALDCCASPRHARWAVKHLLDCPFTLTKDRLSTKIFGDQSYTTGHFTHGLHQYKGKFFPRMVRALLNAHRPEFVLDPFCGSGTLQAEATTAGYESAGFDLNPLAVNICRMKEEILAADSDQFDSYHRIIAPQVRTAAVHQLSNYRDSEIVSGPGAFPQDLASRLSPRDLRFTQKVKAAIESNPSLPYSHIFLMILSDTVKSKVRVRVGGKTAFFYSIEPNHSDLPTKFRERVTRLSTFIHFWQQIKDYLGIRLAATSTSAADARSWPDTYSAPNLVITSPPYFPYTGISYIYTNLAAIAVLGVDDPRTLERHMIGNTLACASTLDNGLREIPQVLKLFSFLEGDKYRKARIPVYTQYLKDLSLVFRQMKLHCAAGADIRFVVPKFQKLYRMHENRTLHRIDCVEIVRTIAEREGLIYIGQIDIPLFKSDKISLFPSNEGVEVVLHLRA